jgi:5'-3' exonuclease
MLLIVDGNSVMFAHQHGGRTLRAGGQETTAIFGTLSTLRNLQVRYPKGHLFVLWDHSPSWRAKEYEQYKANRDKDPKMIKAKDAVKSQQPILRRGLALLGLQQFSQPGMEADDLAAYFASRCSDKLGGKLITADRDWIQLVKPGLDWVDPIHDRVVTDDTFFEDTGFRDTGQFIESKIISGDSGDNVPGLGGLGEGAASIILRTFGSVSALRTHWDAFEPTIQKGDPWVRYRKKVQAFLDLGDEGQRRYDFGQRMMRLDAARVDVSLLKVNLERDHSLFKQWLGQNAFGSIITRFDDWVGPFNIRK